MTEDTGIYIAITNEWYGGEVYRVTKEAYNSYKSYKITQTALKILGIKICNLTDHFLEE